MGELMLLSTYTKNNNGMGLLEVVISIFITSIGIMAIFSLMAPGWRTAARADYMGRATEILGRQLDISEAYILNKCDTAGNAAIGLPPLPGPGLASGPLPYNVISSGSAAAINGDSTFTVNTTITCLNLGYYRVLVNVSWTGNAAGSTSQSVYVSQQDSYNSGCL
jgi:Prokaryotic N-terminal methylation motif